MQKIFSKILISVILVGIFLMPIGGVVGIKNEKLVVEIEINQAIAQSEQEPIWHFQVTKTEFHPNPNINSITTTIFFTSVNKPKASCDAERTVAESNPSYNVPGLTIGPCTSKDGDLVSSTFSNVQDSNGKKIEADPGFGCRLLNLDNCFAALLYFALYKPAAFFAELSARFLDYFMYYSISSKAYDNIFMSKAWGAVRDIANIFFIVALLFVAIKTILGMNVSGNKKMIGTIIIVALFINFSLFTTQVIVDASNILAKIFYHNITPKNENGVMTASKGEKSITVQVASIFDPQEVMGGPPGDENEGTWIIVALVSIIISIFMIFIFLSVAFLFIGRVVELWVAMIFSPIAFASKTISGKIPGFGWDEWLSGLLKSAFLAPIFIFFLYIVVLLGGLISSAGLTEKAGSTSEGLEWAMNVIIPFAITFLLLYQSKKIAQDYSGKVGKAIAGGATALAGLALGGAALGTAFAGRQVMGGLAAKASRSDNAMHHGNALMDHDKTVQDWKSKGSIGNKPKFEDTWANYKTEQAAKNVTVKDKLNPWEKLGGNVNFSQMKSGKINTARHEVDELKKEIGRENTSDANLSGADEKLMKENFTRKKRGDIETKIKRGDKDTELTTSSNSKVLGESKFRQVEREYLVKEAMKDSNNTEMKKGKKVLTAEAAQQVNMNLNVKFDEELKKQFDKLAASKFEKTVAESKQSVGVGGALMAKSTSGSYDVRNISQLTADKRDGLGMKATAGLISAVAMGIRMGMKKGIGAEHGTSSKDFATDIKNLVGGALKDIKIDVSVPSGGGEVKGKASGGGHGGGH